MGTVKIGIFSVNKVAFSCKFIAINISTIYNFAIRVRPAVGLGSDK
jgi:hypothetical protein